MIWGISDYIKFYGLYILKPYTKNRLSILLQLGLGGICISILLRIVNGVSLLEPGTIVSGFLLGVVVGIFELFLFKSWLRNFNFLFYMFIKSIILTLVIYILISFLIFIDFLAGEITSITAYIDNVLSLKMFFGTIEAFTSISVLLFFIKLDQILGPGNLLAYLKGTFHNPRQEERIFMFLDLKNSTMLAESMSDIDYYSFLNDYFFSMTEAILETGAQIYHYVGDEIVLTWYFDKGIENNNCINIFFKIQDQINTQRSYFLKKYGMVPEFKAGVHFGFAIRAQIGELKREIVFNGDVLNTTSRIQAACNEFGKNLLVSGELHRHLNISKAKSVNIGPVNLKGKVKKTELFSIERS